MKGCSAHRNGCFFYTAVAIVADPSLNLIPAAADVMTYDLVTTPAAVKAELDAVNDLLEAGDVQAARVRLSRIRVKPCVILSVPPSR